MHVHDIKSRRLGRQHLVGRGRQVFQEGADITLSFTLRASYKDGIRGTGEVRDWPS